MTDSNGDDEFQETQPAEFETETQSQHITSATKSKKPKGQQLYGQLMDECKEIASFAARDFASAPQVIEFLRQVKMQLYKGVLPKLQESDNTNNTVLFNPTGCDVDENAICITDRIRNTGRNCTARYKRSGELATKTGRKSKKSKNSNALVVEKRCGVCKQAKTVCPVMMCIRQHGLLMKKRNYAWVLACNIPKVSQIDYSFVNDGAFDSQWCHVIVRNMYIDHSGGKFVRIATLDQQMGVTKQQKLFSFMALKQWLETKANHKLLVLEHSIDSQKLFGLWSPRITIKIPNTLSLTQA